MRELLELSHQRSLPVFLWRQDLLRLLPDICSRVRIIARLNQYAHDMQTILLADRMYGGILFCLAANSSVKQTPNEEKHVLAAILSVIHNIDERYNSLYNHTYELHDQIHPCIYLL